MTDESPGHAPFQAHVELLQSCLARRGEIVEALQGVLNAQRKPAAYRQDHALLSRLLDKCFFARRTDAGDDARLGRELEQAHRASGFRPRRVPGLHNDVVDPAEMARRAFYCWQQTRWPGRNGRVRYAQTLFDLYLIRRLELLSMRIWDAGAGGPGERLAQVQSLLDEVRRTAPDDQPALVRDARWLIPLAQSPTTDELAAYFDVAERVAETLADRDALEIQKAHVQMLGGHLRSQMRHYCLEDGVPIDDRSVVLRTRTSNALDLALLIQGLVPLLGAYERARASGDGERGREMAGAICQGISPDPELFVNRIDLLGAYSMIEHLFVATGDDGRAAYTPMGRRHVALFREYAALIGRLAPALHDDCPPLAPVDGTYSPYGAIFGTPTNLIEDMALKTMQPDAETRFGLEDVFDDSGADAAARLDWVGGWRNLPHVDEKVRALYAYPQRFAEDIFERVEDALRRPVSGDAAGAVPETGRLFVARGDGDDAVAGATPVPALPAEFVVASDAQVVAGGAAEPRDEARLLRDRQEGYFAVSYETPGGWVAIRKDMLTEVLGAGHDARIVGLPPPAAATLALTCPDLVAGDGAAAHQASMPPSTSNA